MWTIWKEELYKIVSRKLIWIGVGLLLAFITFRVFAERDNYSITDGGKVISGQQAIERDQELTKEFAGVLTEEKIRQIYEKYGFYYFSHDPNPKIGNFNFCNRFVTEKFTNYMQTSGEDPDEIRFFEGEEWESNAAPLLNKEVRFDYVYGWDDFSEMCMMAFLVLYCILMIGLSPVFAEEYTLKTADILRTTRRGKQSGILIRILASVCFAEALTLGIALCIFLIYLFIYGKQGLDASALLLNFASVYGYCPESVGGFLLYILFLGLMGTLLLSGITLGISAMSKSPFLALVISLIVFFFPVFWVKVLGPMWLFGISLTKNITHFMTSMPVYLPMSTGFAFTEKQMAVHLGIAFLVSAGGMGFSYYRFRSVGKI